MAFKPTKEQELAITENGNILVSAAAGSGKTAVLVERVISKLCNKNNPTRADELLIVTFTNAAAAEMRSRIEKRLDEECRKNPNDAGLLLQKHLLSNAKICTIDSFCIDLVRENFDKLDISPDFKIGDNSSLQAINEQVLYSIINRYLEEKNPLFFELLDIVGAEFDERNFAELVLSVYEFSRQLPFPSRWFDFLLQNYNCGQFSKENIWYKYAFDKLHKTTASMQQYIINAIDLVSTVEEAANGYLSVFSDAAEKINTLKENANTGDWNLSFEALENFKLLRLPTVRGVKGLPAVEAAKDIYKYLSTKPVEKLKKLFYADFDFINSQFSKLQPALQLFIEILKEFDQTVFEAYKEQNIFTFHNTEHLALKLLCKEDEDVVSVAENATELLNQFKEVMVDEYQDTNDLQNMLFYVLSNFEKKLFVVGDVKQSIYAFRGANPENFLSKKNSYISIEKAAQNDAKKIVLGNNFRSKDQVCEFVNFFFRLFMQENTGSIIYNSEEELIPAAEFPFIDENAVSFDLIDSFSTKENTLVLEARQIAAFIKKTTNGKPCIRVDENTLRKADYGDFTILLRSVATKAPQLVEELKKQGIPVSLNVGTFAESVEISTFLSLLKVIDNPQSDIELLTVMMSPIFSFSADDMAVIRSNKRNGNLYSAVIFAAQNGDIKCEKFLKALEKYRLDAVTLPLSKLLSKLLVNTEYLNIASAMPGGEQRRNNLLLLCDFAEQFVTDSVSSLSAFIDYVLKQSQSISSNTFGNSNAVNIMSIHASKGLQFPICILGNTTARFNDAESRSSAAYSTKYGLGFKYFDEDDKQKYTTLSREVILEDIKQSALEEELRLLYVAMTRAQDKLHFVSTFNNLENALAGYKNLLISSNNRIDFGLFSRTKSYADWLLLALLLHPGGKKLKDSLDSIIPLDTSSKIDVNIINGENLTTNVNVSNYIIPQADMNIVAKMQENFAYKYPYYDLLRVQSKMSVSLLANKAESDKFAFTSTPSFMSKGGVTAAGRGTAMHKVMELYDFEKANDIESEIERLYEWQFINDQERESLNLEALRYFFNSEILNRIKASTRVERELRFMTEISACEIDTSLDNSYKDEMVIVQGAVDVCFIEDGELVILDFKTDRVEDINELAKSYGEQLSVYAKACEKIFTLPVKEKVIYSFAKSGIVTIK